MKQSLEFGIKGKGFRVQGFGVVAHVTSNPLTDHAYDFWDVTCSQEGTSIYGSPSALGGHVLEMSLLCGGGALWVLLFEASCCEESSHVLKY